MATSPVATRLPDWLDLQIREYWERHGERPSPGYRRVIEEWWVAQSMPALEFRDGPAGRRVGIRGGPDVWEVVMVARAHGHDLMRIGEHFGDRVDRSAVEQALQYEERFPAVVQEQLRANERVEQLLSCDHS